MVHIGLRVLLFSIIFFSSKSHCPLCRGQSAKVKVIKIGAIFEGSDEQMELIFRQTINRINLDKSRMSKPRLEPQVARINQKDSFHAAKVVCKLIEEGAWAIFGPESSSVSWLIRSIADNLNVPLFLMNWDHRFSHRFSSNITLNMHPDPSVLSQAFSDLVLSKNWKSFAIVYEEEDQLIRVKHLLGMSSVKILIRQLATSSVAYGQLFREIKGTGETNVVLSISRDKVTDALTAARESGLLTEYNNFIIASLDIHVMNLTRFAPSNISGLTLDSMGKKSFTVRQALLVDALWLFVAGLDQLFSTSSVFAPKVTCESQSSWALGRTLVNLMKVLNVRGITGRLRFNHSGERSDFALDVLELNKLTLLKTGSWTRPGQINFTRNYTQEELDIRESVKKKTFRVVVPTNSPPYVSRKGKGDGPSANMWEGFCIDLLDEIASLLGFKYELYPASNDAYGQLLNGEWNGMMGELVHGRADMAIADLTITHERQSAVDFTVPFMNLGISIILKKMPEQVNGNIFSFLRPFSPDLWLYILTAIIGVTILFYVISRLSPYEWVYGGSSGDAGRGMRVSNSSSSSSPLEEETTDELENQFCLSNCLWFALASLMHQRSHVTPRALSTRTLASIWSFFTLIIISSYTANLAAFLTVSRMAASPIENVEDLAKQSIISYGCKEGGSTCNFFKSSNYSTYERMWSTMQSQSPSVFVQSNRDGIDRVKRGDFALLMESSSIEYSVQLNCDLTQIGGLLDHKSYAIATPTTSPYTKLLSWAIVTLRTSGKLNQLKNRWWGAKRDDEDGIGGGEGGRVNCHPFTHSPVNSMGHKLSDMGEIGGGIFLLLLAGSAFACLLVIMELIWKTKKVARKESRSKRSCKRCQDISRTHIGSKLPRPQQPPTPIHATAATSLLPPILVLENVWSIEPRTRDAALLQLLRQSPMVGLTEITDPHLETAV